jgi:uncharacterized phage protein (TIGR02218 family)
MCWSVKRRDGVIFGFTDHDRPLAFEGMAFVPQGGMSARALASSVGLSVNNTAALGVLSADAITEFDILAGRYDGAEVVTWRVQWDNVDARQVQFRGTMGEITRGAGGFEAELHGLTDALNQPQGRSFLKTCSAVLGDARCRFNVDDPAFSVTHRLTADCIGAALVLDGVTAFGDRWFENGLCTVVSGDARGLMAAIKSDTLHDSGRVLMLWTQFAQGLHAGDTIRIVAGCDKSAATCTAKFDNLVNFQGFPDIPGEDWLVSAPRSSQRNSGGSLTR